ncbi:MAG: hypothetical protein ACJ75J_00490 [Cytophagaceae bacterium]
MKKILMGIMIAVSAAACSKSSNMSSTAVPDQVVASFNQRYPYASEVHWGMDNGLYEAQFKDAGSAQKDVLYRSDGTLMQVR